MHDLVSIIIPTYNRQKLVPRAIESCLSQTHAHLEIIVIDDGSTDRTCEVLATYAENQRVTVVSMPVNGGNHIARNHGIEIAHGEWLLFLDSDDELYPNAVEALLSCATRHPTAGFICAPYRTDDGDITGFALARPGFVPAEDYLCNKGFNGRSRVIVSLLKRAVVGELRFPIQSGDFMFFHRVAMRTSIFATTEPLGIYHLFADAQALTLQRRKKNVLRSSTYAPHLCAYLDEFQELLSKHCPRLFAAHAYGAAVGLLLANKRKEARAYAVRGCKAAAEPRMIALTLLTLVPKASSIMRMAFRTQALLKERTAKAF